MNIYASQLIVNQKHLIYCIPWQKNDQVQFNLIMVSSGIHPLWSKSEDGSGL